MTTKIITVGARFLTRDVIPRSVVVTEVRDSVVMVRDEATGENFAEVAAYAERVWSRRPSVRGDAKATRPSP